MVNIAISESPRQENLTGTPWTVHREPKGIDFAFAIKTQAFRGNPDLLRTAARVRLKEDAEAMVLAMNNQENLIQHLQAARLTLKANLRGEISIADINAAIDALGAAITQAGGTL